MFARAVSVAGLVAAVWSSYVRAAPELGVTPAFLTIDASVSTGVMKIWNRGDGVLTWSITSSADWLSVGQWSGANDPNWANRTEVVVFVDRAGLAQGTYAGQLAVTSDGGESICGVTMHVQIAPKLSLSPSVVFVSLNDPNGALTIRNGGAETLTWSAAGDSPWVDVVPSSGDVPTFSVLETTVVLDPASLPSQSEEHTAQVTVTSNGGDASVPIVFVPTWVTGGILGLYADPQGVNCNIVYSGPGLAAVYVVHTHTNGAVAVQFSAPKPDCCTNAVYLSDTDIFPVTIGNSQTGKAVPYGTCVSPTIHATTINYFVQGPPGSPCCVYPVLPDPWVASGQIEMLDCSNTVRYALGGYAVIHPDVSCMCERGTVRVENTTWGRVKSLYAPE